MEYYLDENNTVHALTDGSDPSEWIAGRAKKITEEKAISIANPPPTKKELIEQAEHKKQALIAEATATIAPLQYAVDLDIATPEEISALKELMTYTVILNRVDTSLGADVVWPMPPA